MEIFHSPSRMLLSRHVCSQRRTRLNPLKRLGIPIVDKQRHVDCSSRGNRGPGRESAWAPSLAPGISRGIAGNAGRPVDICGAGSNPHLMPSRGNSALCIDCPGSPPPQWPNRVHFPPLLWRFLQGLLQLDHSDFGMVAGPHGRSPGASAARRVEGVIPFDMQSLVVPSVD